MKLYLFSAILSTYSLLAECQEVSNNNNNNLSEINIGGYLPTLTLENTINHKKSTINTTSYEGKLLILDFWATWCTPCVANLPKLDSLQKKFSGKIQILPVTYQTPTEVTKLLDRLPRLKAVSLPMVTSDNTLRYLFPHRQLPHYVWVNGNGKVIAITGDSELNEDNLQKALVGSTGTLKLKKDIIPEFTFDREKPILLQQINFQPEQLKFQSLLTNYKEGLSVRYDGIRGESGGLKKISMLNYSIKNLFMKAWTDVTKKHFFERTTVIVETKEPDKVYYGLNDSDGYKEWLRENSWCYEQIIPGNVNMDMFEVMRSDMKKYFPQYTALVEKRVLRCLVLERTSNIDKIKSKGEKANQEFYSSGGSMTNCKLTLLVRLLSYYLQLMDMPIVDATGYNESVDLNLEANITNIDSLRKALHKYDLDIVEKDYEIEVLVIKDRN